MLFERAREGPDLLPLAPTGELDLRAAWTLSQIIRDLRPDVVHAQDAHAVSLAALALSFGAPSPAPQLVAARRVDFHVQGHAFSRWKHRRVELFIAASDAIRRILLSDGVPDARITVVHDGIDVGRLAAVPAENIHELFWFPHGAPVVAHVGALVAHKGQKYLVDAMARVRRTIPDAQLVIFGEGELRADLERQVHQRGLDKHVVLAGFRDHIAGLVRSADLFVMSSVTEGLGSAVLDAMALGLPVVGTRAGGIPEAVVDGVTGLLVRPGDAAALADAIVALLRDPERRRQFGEAGQARVAETFGVDRLVEGTLAAYRRAAGRPAVSAPGTSVPDAPDASGGPDDRRL